jgi:hypothetical protein
MTTLPPRHACGAPTRRATTRYTSYKQKTEGSESAATAFRGGRTFRTNSGAGNESRTHDLNLGKVALYQLSYSRVGGGL